MRPTRTLLLSALILALPTLAACGGSPAATTQATATQGASTGGEPTEVATATATENGGGGDAEAVADDLVPPNSTEVQRTESSGVFFVIYSSTDSFDSLKSFYEGAIPSAGMKIISTTEQSGTIAWIFAKDEGSTFGGAVSITPDSAGGSGQTVSVTVGES
jgi:hypothetical protein